MVGEYDYAVKYAKFRGWGIEFKKDFVSVTAAYTYDELEPSLFISREDPETYVQKKIEDLMDDFQYEANAFNYIERYNNFSFLQWLFCGVLFKIRYKRQSRDEFYLRITESGNFVKDFFSEIIKAIDDPKIRVRKAYTGYYSEHVKQ